MGKEWDSPGKSFVERKADRGNSWDHVGGNHNPTSAADQARTRRVEDQRFQAWCETWAAECLRVLKPGGYLAAFSSTRTYHRLACGVEDAGLEIRDSLHWIYGSGFPKGNACLKPAHEPIVLARKPARKSAPLPGLDACRVAGEYVRTTRNTALGVMNDDVWQPKPGVFESHDAGRWPPNVLLSEEAAAELDRQSGTLTSGANPVRRSSDKFRDAYGEFAGQAECTPHRGADAGGASRFFPVFRYQAKAPASERPRLDDGTAWPTVKPVALMQWLVRLVTPTGGLVLDPFAGTGTTGQACRLEGFRCVLAERDETAAQLTVRRLAQGVLAAS